jgi:Rieske Fe-S protein
MVQPVAAMNQTMNDSRRRSFLKWMSGLLGLGNAAVVGLPTIWYASDSLRRQSSPETKFRRIARLADLPQGRPVLIPIIGDVQDAWTLHPKTAIGRAWVTRDAIDLGNPGGTNIRALSAVCPHLGCMIQLSSDGKQFVCPCHRADFGLNGERLVGVDSGRPCPAPRGLDELQYQVVQDEANTDWWVEVKYEFFEQGRTTSQAMA